MCVKTFYLNTKYSRICKVFTYRRPEQIANAILYDFAVRVVLDIILLPILILLSAPTAAITLVHVRAVTVDVKAKQTPSLGVLPGLAFAWLLRRL